LREAESALAIRTKQLEAGDMGTEASGDVMVLAVYVIGQRATQSDEARARRHSEKPPLRNDDLQNFGQSNSRFCAQQPVDRIESNETVEASREQGIAPVVERHVTVGSAIAVGQQGPINRDGQRASAIVAA
jgi:hypothetical protein